LKFRLVFVLSLLVIGLQPALAQEDPNNPDEIGPTVLGDFFKKIFDTEALDKGEKKEDVVSSPAATTTQNKSDPTSDRLSFRSALGQVMESSKTGNLNHWQNPVTKVHGTITPTRTVMSGGKPCREYDSTWITSGKTVAYVGVACRTRKGQWPIREEKEVAATADTPWVSPDANGSTASGTEPQPIDSAPDTQSGDNKTGTSAGPTDAPSHVKDAKGLVDSVQSLFKDLGRGNHGAPQQQGNNPAPQSDTGDQNSGDAAPFDPSAPNDQASGNTPPFDFSAPNDQASGDTAPFDPSAPNDQALDNTASFDPSAPNDQAPDSDTRPLVENVIQTPPLLLLTVLHRACGSFRHQNSTGWFCIRAVVSSRYTFIQ